MLSEARLQHRERARAHLHQKHGEILLRDGAVVDRRLHRAHRSRIARRHRLRVVDIVHDVDLRYDDLSLHHLLYALKRRLVETCRRISSRSSVLPRTKKSRHRPRKMPAEQALTSSSSTGAARRRPDRFGPPRRAAVLGDGALALRRGRHGALRAARPAVDDVAALAQPPLQPRRADLAPRAARAAALAQPVVEPDRGDGGPARAPAARGPRPLVQPHPDDRRPGGARAAAAAAARVQPDRQPGGARAVPGRPARALRGARQRGRLPAGGRVPRRAAGARRGGAAAPRPAQPAVRAAGLPRPRPPAAAAPPPPRRPGDRRRRFRHHARGGGRGAAAGVGSARRAGGGGGGAGPRRGGPTMRAAGGARRGRRGAADADAAH